MSSGVLRQTGLVSEIRPGQGVTSDPIPLYGRGYYRPGILIFSHRHKLLHASRRALELVDHLGQAELGPVCEIDSTPVHELRHAIQAALDHRKEADIWEVFELKRIIFEARRTILVRGFGLADRQCYDDSRIVIVLEELDTRAEHSETGRLVMASSRENGALDRRLARRGFERGCAEVLSRYDSVRAAYPTTGVKEGHNEAHKER